MGERHVYAHVRGALCRSRDGEAAEIRDVGFS
jgi:hypothetical protein